MEESREDTRSILLELNKNNFDGGDKKFIGGKEKLRLARDGGKTKKNEAYLRR